MARRSRIAIIALSLACTPRAQPTEPHEDPVVGAVESSSAEIPELGRELGLPSRPDFVGSQIPAIYADKTFSIRGLRFDAEGLLRQGEAGKVVAVSAYVQEVDRPPECPVDARCPPARPAHAWLVDDPRELGKAEALLLTGIEFPIPAWDDDLVALWADFPPIELVAGRRYVFIGWFRAISAHGFADERGLLELYALTEHPLEPEPSLVIPPNSPHHPLTLEWQGVGTYEPEFVGLTAKLNGWESATAAPLVTPRDYDHALALAREADQPLHGDYYYRWAIVREPEQIPAWAELSILYVDGGFGDAGEELLALAIARMPERGELHNVRGRNLHHMGRFEPAIDAFRRALELQPDYTDALFGLGMTYADLGRRQEAIATLERYLELADEGPLRRAAQDTIMRMQEVR